MVDYIIGIFIRISEGKTRTLEDSLVCEKYSDLYIMCEIIGKQAHRERDGAAAEWGHTVVTGECPPTPDSRAARRGQGATAR